MPVHRKRRTKRGLLAFLLVAAALGLPGAPATAQGPPDPLVKARALGEVALSAQTELRALGPGLEASFGRTERKISACVKRALGENQVDEEVEESLVLIELLGVLPPVARIVAAPVRRASERMTAVATGDRILAAGVKVWVEQGDFYARLASVRASACSVLADWRHDGFKLSKAPPELLALLKILDAEPESTGARPEPMDLLERAERRLLQLGVSSRAAAAFGQTLEDFSLGFEATSVR